MKTVFRKARPRTLKQIKYFVACYIGAWLRGKKRWRFSSYACPVCGEFSDEDYGQESSTMLECTPPISNPYYSYEFGVDGSDWEETHQCNECGTVFRFTNGSC